MITNLQLITNKKNTSKDRKNKTSKYTGVSWHKQSNKWLAQFKENGTTKYLGTFESEEEARDAYNASQERLYSEEDMIAYHEWAENSSDAYDFWNTNKRHPTMDNSYMEYMREKKKELFQIWKSKFKK